MPWKPGESGNPNGRPSRSHNTISITAELRKSLAEPETVDDDGNVVTKAQVTARRLLELASCSDKRTSLSAISMIIERIDGRPQYVQEDQDEVMTSEQAQDQIRAAVQSNPRVRAWLDKTLQNKGEIEPVQENQRLKVVLDAVSTKN